MENTLLIVAGDCGFGFENKSYYENIVKKNAKRMNDNNNWILFVRGIPIFQSSLFIYYFSSSTAILGKPSLIRIISKAKISIR